MASQAAASDMVGSRGLPDATVMAALANLIVSASDVRVRSVLLRFKSCETYEVNSKAVSSSKKPELQATLMFLRGIEGDNINSEIPELLQPGLVHCVILEVMKLLPYQCTSCTNEVVNLRLELPSVHCRGCGIGACSDCFSTAVMGWTFLCHPCGSTVDKKRKTPVHMMNSRGRKKSSATTLTTLKENAVPEPQDEEVTIEDVEDDEESSRDTQDETDYLPPGQGSPPLQSTQASASTLAVREFPVLSLDMSRIQDTLASASSQPIAGFGDDNEEVSGDLSDDFILPPKRVKAVLLKQKQATKLKEVVITNAEDIEATTCRFFMKGCCKFGFYGKGKADQGKCPYKHPKTCKRFMDNGTGQGGCSKGKTCTTVHPKMCHQSLATRTCTNIKDGARCSGGYHVRGTKYSPNKPLGGHNASNVKASQEVNGESRGNRRDTTPSSSSFVLPNSSFPPVISAKPLNSSKSLGEQQAALQSVFHEIIRIEVVKLLQTGSLWPQPVSQSCGPVVPPVASRGLDTTTTMGNLGALLSLMGAQHQQ
jgi:hypothetical protein